jgi:hypothetical protein
MFCELSMAQSVDGRTDKLSARRDLAIPISALYLLARPSTPKDVRDQVLERVQQSGGISLAETRSVILQVSRSAGVASPAEFVVERSEKSPSAPIRLQISREERVRPTMTGRDMLADSIRLAQRQIVHFETRFSQDFGFIDALTPVRDLLHAARDKVEELLRDYRDET